MREVCTDCPVKDHCGEMLDTDKLNTLPLEGVGKFVDESRNLADNNSDVRICYGLHKDKCVMSVLLGEIPFVPQHAFLKYYLEDLNN